MVHIIEFGWQCDILIIAVCALCLSVSVVLKIKGQGYRESTCTYVY